MRAVIFLAVIVTVVADLPPSLPVPIVLEKATPVQVLLYLYDVVLTSYMSLEVNNEGNALNSYLCPGGKPKLLSGVCPPTDNKTDTSIKELRDLFGGDYDYN